LGAGDLLDGDEPKVVPSASSRVAKGRGLASRETAAERKESHLRDSNPGLQLYESCALPTELRWQKVNDMGAWRHKAD
jgi:hypothetical protein